MTTDMAAPSSRPAASARDSAFARAVERGEIAPADFDHAAHLRLALAYLSESPSPAEAAERMAAALRRFAAAAGKPEKYHHTLTVFWMRAVARLLDKGLPLAYYSPGRLWSDAARAEWLPPDLQPIDGATPRPADPPRDAPHRPLPR
jgi:hypothetical protein